MVEVALRGLDATTPASRRLRSAIYYTDFADYTDYDSHFKSDAKSTEFLDSSFVIRYPP
jgi:hypothetical protein